MTHLAARYVSIILFALGITLLGSPMLFDTAPSASAQESSPSVEVIDPSGQLNRSDVELLESRTAGTELPAEISQVTYVLFESNDDLLNDTVRSFAEESRPDLITTERDKWAPGQLIVAVGLDPSRMGVYCGDDVCSAIGIYDSGRLDGILDRMETPLSNENWAAGLLAGTEAAGDPSATRGDEHGEGSGTPGWVAGSIAGVAAVAGVGGIGAAVVYSRRKKAAKARTQFDDVQRDYGRVSTNLDAIDIRAHSLSSPLANDSLRKQWAQVRDGFLDVHSSMDELDGLEATSEDRKFLQHASSISQAHEALSHVLIAEEHIEELSQMEHGNADVRRRELSDMHEDILEAIVADASSDLVPRLEAVDARVIDLRNRLDSPTFMNEFADLINDHRVLVEAAQQRLYAASGTEVASEAHSAPALWDHTWRPGYGYGGYVPFAVVNTWHNNDVAAAQAASSSSATTGYSGGGFSGGGGSRGF